MVQACATCMFLGLFCGTGHFTMSLNELGVFCLGIDWLCPKGSSEYLCRADLRNAGITCVILHLLEIGKIIGVGGGVHCNTFGLARRGRPFLERVRRKIKGGFPAAVRGPLDLWGFS